MSIIRQRATAKRAMAKRSWHYHRDYSVRSCGATSTVQGTKNKCAPSLDAWIKAGLLGEVFQVSNISDRPTATSCRLRVSRSKRIFSGTSQPQRSSGGLDDARRASQDCGNERRFITRHTPTTTASLRSNAPYCIARPHDPLALCTMQLSLEFVDTAGSISRASSAAARIIEGRQ
jgi:hypothetical protein